jgi:hypothetical protein
MDDKEKEKSVIDKFMDNMTSAVGGVVRAAVMPTRDTKEEAVVEKANEQMFLGDAAVAPEAIPAPAKKRRAPAKQTTPPAKNRQRPPAKKTVSKAAKSAKKTKKAAPKKSKKKR